MKLYLVFKVKDMNKRQKEFICDSVYACKHMARKREARIHGFNNNLELCLLRSMTNTGLVKTKQQQTYIIEKKLKPGVKEIKFK